VRWGEKPIPLFPVITLKPGWLRCRKSWEIFIGLASEVHDCTRFRWHSGMCRCWCGSEAIGTSLVDPREKPGVPKT
jgi:hypothetical protein